MCRSSKDLALDFTDKAGRFLINASHKIKKKKKTAITEIMDPILANKLNLV